MNETMVTYARRAYDEGRIDIFDYEDALDHIAAGGVGCAEFPYLPAYEAFEPESIPE